MAFIVLAIVGALFFPQWAVEILSISILAGCLLIAVSNGGKWKKNLTQVQETHNQDDTGKVQI